MLVLMHVFGCIALAARTWKLNMRYPSADKCFVTFASFYTSVTLFQVQ